MSVTCFLWCYGGIPLGKPNVLPFEKLNKKIMFVCRTRTHQKAILHKQPRIYFTFLSYKLHIYLSITRDFYHSHKICMPKLPKGEKIMLELLFRCSQIPIMCRVTLQKCLISKNYPFSISISSGLGEYCLIFQYFHYKEIQFT